MHHAWQEPNAVFRAEQPCVDLWTMRLRRTGKLTVDNAARYPPRVPSPTSSTALNYG